LLVSIAAKLMTLLLTALINPDTCLFRSLDRQRILVARQIILTIAMGFFFIIQCSTGPFSNPVNNASEWTSRLSFVLTSAVSLGTVLDVPGKDVLEGVVIYMWASASCHLGKREIDSTLSPQHIHFDLRPWNLCAPRSLLVASPPDGFLDFTVINFSFVQHLVKRAFF
jgi:hypothetical protein